MNISNFTMFNLNILKFTKININNFSDINFLTNLFNDKKILIRISIIMKKTNRCKVHRLNLMYNMI